MDCSEFETARGGIWRICAAIDFATKYCLAATVTPMSRGQDARGCLRWLRRAVVEAGQRAMLSWRDLR
jgi:putative transposase